MLIVIYTLIGLAALVVTNLSSFAVARKRWTGDDLRDSHGPQPPRGRRCRSHAMHAPARRGPVQNGAFSAPEDVIHATVSGP